MNIRQADKKDVSRIAEILVYNNRVNFFPIFKDESYSFGEMQVLTVADELLKNEKTLSDTYVYDDGIVRGMIHIDGKEIVKLYVDTFFQSRGIGAELFEYAVTEKQVEFLWALEKNVRAIAFYERQGFCVTGERKFEEGTTEYLVKMKKKGV